MWKNAKNDQIRIASLSLFADMQEREFALVSNSAVLDDALQFVSGEYLKKVVETLEKRNNKKQVEDNTNDISEDTTGSKEATTE